MQTLCRLRLQACCGSCSAVSVGRRGQRGLEAVSKHPGGMGGVPAGYWALTTLLQVDEDGYFDVCRAGRRASRRRAWGGGGLGGSVGFE